MQFEEMNSSNMPCLSSSLSKHTLHSLHTLCSWRMYMQCTHTISMLYYYI